MKKINIESFFPEKIKNYEKLNSKINIAKDILEFEDLEKELKDVPEGDSKECLISYMNHLYQLVLRVEGRGKRLKLKAEKIKVIYDEIGPIAGVTEKIEYISAKSFAEAILVFHDWLKNEIK